MDAQPVNQYVEGPPYQTAPSYAFIYGGFCPHLPAAAVYHLTTLQEDRDSMKKLSVLVMLVAAFAALSLSGASAADTSVTVQLNAQNGSGESGTATITQVDANSVRVVVNLTGGGAALADPQPAHIHTGTCANLNPAPKYPLTSVVNGKSDTTVKASWDELSKSDFAINVHKSATEAATYVSCGDITAMMAGAMSGGTTTGGTSTSGGSTMPVTGNGDMLLLAFALVLGALTLTGAGLVLRRNRI
jgi:hypothetical protein